MSSSHPSLFMEAAATSNYSHWQSNDASRIFLLKHQRATRAKHALIFKYEKLSKDKSKCFFLFLSFKVRKKRKSSYFIYKNMKIGLKKKKKVKLIFISCWNPCCFVFPPKSDIGGFVRQQKMFSPLICWMLQAKSALFAGVY